MKTILILFLFLCSLYVSAQNKWLKLSGPQGGFPTALKAFGDSIFAGVGGDKGRLYYSFDRGNSWNSSIKLNQRVTDFVKADDNTLIFNAGNLGIFKTSDFKTYTGLYSNGQYFICLIKDKTGVIYAGTDGGNIYRSTNNGLTWTFSLSNNTGYDIYNFAQLSDSTILAGTADYIYYKKPSGNWNAIYIDNWGDVNVITDIYDNIYAFTNGTMKLSTDKGITWTNRDQNGFMHGNYMYSCIYNNRLIGAFGDETGWFGNGWGIALSDDQGLTWRWNNTGLPPKFAATIHLTTSGNDTYVGTNAAGIYKSTDFGDCWFSVNNGINAANTFAVNFDNEGNLWAACYSNGIYKSTDKGLSWNLKNNGFTNSYVYNLISDDNDNLFASTEGGTFRSLDKGESWNQISSLFFYYLNKDKFNRIYGLSYGSGLYRTTDQGNNWTRLDNGFINGYVFGFAIDSSNNIYTGTFGGAIYKSTDDGSTWSNVYQSNIQGSEVNKIAIAPNGTIFATNWNEGILRSTDNGLTWTLQKSDNYNPQYYPVNVNKKGLVFVAGSNSKFYFSSDNGNTWSDVTDNLEMTSVQDIIFDKDDKMYLGTNESVWTSNDEITPVELVNFTASSEGNIVTLKWNTATEINNLDFSIERKTSDSTVWNNLAFIKGAGNSTKPINYSYINNNVAPGKYNYRLKQTDINGDYKYYSLQNEVVVDNPITFALEQNYPNPFNPSTTILYSLKDAGMVKLEIYDILGRRVRTLVNEEKLPGEYKVNFIGTNLASGVYIYRLTSGTFTQVKKMQLLK